MSHLLDAIEQLFSDIELETASFAQQSGVKCKAGCGACCEKPGSVWATVAEMLPLARRLCREGRVEETLTMMRQKSTSICVSYRPSASGFGMGRCGTYQQRPMTCRLFGSALRSGKAPLERQFLGCGWQRVEFSDRIDALESGMILPSKTLAQGFAMQLRMLVLDQELLCEYPINDALANALSYVNAGRFGEETRCDLPNEL